MQSLIDNFNKKVFFNKSRSRKGFKGEGMKAIDYIRIALAIETLAYYDKNYLNNILAYNNDKLSETIQSLLKKPKKI